MHITTSLVEQAAALHGLYPRGGKVGGYRRGSECAGTFPETTLIKLKQIVRMFIAGLHR